MAKLRVADTQEYLPGSGGGLSARRPRHPAGINSLGELGLQFKAAHQYPALILWCWGKLSGADPGAQERCRFAGLDLRTGEQPRSWHQRRAGTGSEYRWLYRPYLAVTPDFQYIWKPGGSSIPGVAVAG